MIAWGFTDRGVVRAQNQDSFFLRVYHETNQAIAAVCDGMGGARAGDIASKLAMDTFAHEVERLIKPGMPQKAIRRILARAAQLANGAVYKKASSGGFDLAGMGTTLVCALVSGYRAVVLNVGDSRAYLADESGIARVTRDHSLVEDMMDKGDITLEEARCHPSRNLITRALGTDPRVECDLFDLEMSPGDSLLLCSNGLTNVVDDNEILSEVLSGDTPESSCTELLRLACERGGPDNITVVIVSV